jgi:hypothetical protein
VDGLAGHAEPVADPSDVDAATWLLGRGRVLSQALIVLAYHKATNPALCNDARHVIGEVLAAPQ